MKKKELLKLVEDQRRLIGLLDERTKSIYDSIVRMNERIGKTEKKVSDIDDTVRNAAKGDIEDLIFLQDQLGYDLRDRRFRRLDHIENNIEALDRGLRRLGECVSTTRYKLSREENNG